MAVAIGADMVADMVEALAVTITGGEDEGALLKGNNGFGVGN